MINFYVKSYEAFDRDVRALSLLLASLMLAIVGRAVVLVHAASYDQLWPLLPYGIPIVAGLLVVQVGNRQITHANLVYANERRHEIVRVTHHLIAIVKDMRQRVGYARSLLEKGTATPFSLEQISTTIEIRYEVLLQPDPYRYLPGQCVNLIVDMSGSVFGLVTVAKGLSQVAGENPTYAVSGNLPKGSPEILGQLTQLHQELTELLDGIYTVRHSVDDISPPKVSLLSFLQAIRKYLRFPLKKSN